MVGFGGNAMQAMADPYPWYRQLRELTPVGRNDWLQAWLLTRYEDCDRLLRDHATFSSDPAHATSAMAEVRLEERAALGMEAPTVLTTDPPDHTRLRAIVNRAFTPRRIAAMEGRIEALAADLLQTAPPGAPFDVMAGLAQPLPIIVITEMLGVPPEDRDDFKRWSTAIAELTNPTLAAGALPRIRAQRDELAAYLTDVLEARRREPRDDLISAIVQAEADGQELSEDEALGFTVLLLVAGNETTTNLIGNGALALAQAPEQAARLRAEPSRWASAVEELLRYESPVQATVRTALHETTIGGQTIQPGESVIALLGAANRDPERFSDPDRLDITRPDNAHLGFGMGIHYCLGAPLARVEGQIALRALLERFPSLTLDGPPEWGGTFALRGLNRLVLADRKD